ncbi:hypothetical protein FHS40_007006 [Streptomyces spectabilis]|uniref:Uncharacterized protein n=1 Tax=Streptomyces spectabilis TaxID=68270 RepID=A0A7W8B2C8_STRST|nr:hypothetical protein [Streptomyces spectabilis]
MRERYGRFLPSQLGPHRANRKAHGHGAWRAPDVTPVLTRPRQAPPERPESAANPGPIAAEPADRPRGPTRYRSCAPHNVLQGRRRGGTPLTSQRPDYPWRHNEPTVQETVTADRESVSMRCQRRPGTPSRADWTPGTVLVAGQAGCGLLSLVAAAPSQFRAAGAAPVRPRGLDLRRVARVVGVRVAAGADAAGGRALGERVGVGGELDHGERAAAGAAHHVHRGGLLPVAGEAFQDQGPVRGGIKCVANQGVRDQVRDPAQRIRTGQRPAGPWALLGGRLRGPGRPPR